MDFSELTPAERELVEHAVKGTTCTFDPEATIADRTIRGEVLTQLLLDSRMKDDSGRDVVSPRGVIVSNAYISGQVNLAGASLAVGLTATACEFERPLVLLRTEIPHLDLGGATLHADNGIALRADGLQCTGTLRLSRWNKADPAVAPSAAGTLRLRSASVGGNLELSGLEVFKWRVPDTPQAVEADDPDLERDAIILDGAHIAQDVYLDEGFTARGEVRVIGATIDGDLYCDQGSFKNPDRFALDLEDTEIGGRFYWNDVKAVDGSVGLVGASVRTLEDDRASWSLASELRLHRFSFEALAPRSFTDVGDRVAWLARDRSRSTVTYRSLADFYKASGRHRAARKVLADGSWHELKQGPDGFFDVPGWLLRLVLQFLVSNGYRPGRAVLILVGLAVAGHFVVDQAIESSALLPTSPPMGVEVEADNCTDAYPCLDRTAYVLDLLTPLDLNEDKHWRVDDSKSLVWRAAHWFARAAGWGLSLLFVASFTSAVRRDP